MLGVKSVVWVSRFLNLGDGEVDHDIIFITEELSDAPLYPDFDHVYLNLILAEKYTFILTFLMSTGLSNSDGKFHFLVSSRSLSLNFTFWSS